MSGFLHFILGGSRSGKSRHAEAIATAAGLPVQYVATLVMDATDEEMHKRVLLHRNRRPIHWKTIENRFDLGNLVFESEGCVLLVDSVTLWLSYHLALQRSVASILSELQEALDTAGQLQRSVILVSDEVGAGVVPPTEEGRLFRDLCGSANQLVGRCATKVELIVAGLALTLKG